MYNFRSWNIIQIIVQSLFEEVIKSGNKVALMLFVEYGVDVDFSNIVSFIS